MGLPSFRASGALARCPRVVLSFPVFSFFSLSSLGTNALFDHVSPWSQNSSVSPFPKPSCASQAETSELPLGDLFLSHLVWLPRDTRSLSFPRTPCLSSPSFTNAMPHAGNAFPFFSWLLQSQRQFFQEVQMQQVLSGGVAESHRAVLHHGLEPQGAHISATHQLPDYGRKSKTQAG